MSTETESVNEQPEPVAEEAPAETQEEASASTEEAHESSHEVEEAVEETEKPGANVPLTALQKERRRRQEAEYSAKVYKEIYEKAQSGQAAATQEDEDEYEAVTKADLKKMQKVAVREYEEKSWLKSNPEKGEDIEQNLAEFLKHRPHLASAIENAPNRYEEAWQLMNALSPKQKTALSKPSPVKKAAPGSPSGVPKAAGINQATDVMNMTDSEFRAWRQSQRKGR